MSHSDSFCKVQHWGGTGNSRNLIFGLGTTLQVQPGGSGWSPAGHSYRFSSVLLVFLAFLLLTKTSWFQVLFSFYEVEVA